MRLRPRAEVFIFKKNRILCASRKDRGQSYIVFPGGGIDFNESAKDAAIRECFEEAGRKLSNCTVAHPPTVQRWSPEYFKGRGSKWQQGFEGGFTYWMTGSSSDNAMAPAYRHPDYEGGMEWKTVKEVIESLKKELSGDWGDDAKVRLKVLETHLGMQHKHKEASAKPAIKTLFSASTSLFPALNLEHNLR